MEELTIAQLKVIHALAEGGGLQGAADLLGLHDRQSIHRELQEIERKTGIHLNEGRNHWPADQLRESVAAILEIFEHNYLPEAMEIQHRQANVILVGTFAYIVLGLVNHKSVSFAEARKVKVEPVVKDDDGSGRRIGEALLSGEIDVAITYRVPERGTSDAVEIGRNVLTALIPPRNPAIEIGPGLGRRELLALQKRAGKPLLVAKEGFSSREVLESLLCEQPRPQKLADVEHIDFDNVNVLADFVSHGRGIGVAFDATILQREKLEGRGVVFRPLLRRNGQKQTRAILAFRRKASSRGELLDSYIRFLQQS